MGVEGQGLFLAMELARDEEAQCEEEEGEEIPGTWWLKLQLY